MSKALSYLKALFLRTKKDPPESVVTAFVDAKDLRSDFYLDFMSTNGKIIHQARARCIALSKNLARLYFNSKDEYLPNKGMKVSGFFVVPKNKRKMPMTFISEVVESLIQDSSIYIDVALPQEITHGQRRNSVRIPITKIEIPNLKLWAGKEISSVDSENNKKNKITWELVAQEEFGVVNISVGGILLSISKSSPLTHKIRKNFLFLCTGSFDIPQKPTTELALVARVRRITRLEGKNGDFVGLEFCRWAKITEENVKWITINDKGEGVAFLGTWLIPLIVKMNKPPKK